MASLLEPYVDRIADGIYAYVQPDGSWMLNNAGAVGGADGLLLVDTCSTERRTRALLAAMYEASGGAPVRTLLSTHHHGDHTFGNCLVEGAVRVGHGLTRERVLASGFATQALFPDVDYGDLTLAPPEVTFTDRMTVHTGRFEVVARYLGPAHTPDDVIAWLPEQRIVFAGDLVFAGATPFLLMGSVSGFRAAIAALAQLDAEVLVPGHGPVRRGAEVGEALADMAGYSEWLGSYAADAHDAGWEPLEAARRASLGRFADWPERERLVGNLARAYAEIGGAAPGADIDLGAAIAGMLTYAGGPLRCLA